MGDNEARREGARVDLAGVDRRHWTMPTAHRPTCTACGALIRWCRTVAGKMMPLDAEPVDGGNVELTDKGAVVHGQPELIVKGPRYVAHFATCPNWDNQRPQDAHRGGL